MLVNQAGTCDALQTISKLDNRDCIMRPKGMIGQESKVDSKDLVVAVGGVNPMEGRGVISQGEEGGQQSRNVGPQSFACN